LLMDDLDGRKEAIRLGLTVMGTIGVLIHAKQQGISTQFALCLMNWKPSVSTTVRS
jgi:Predicted nucleic acid-binding protein, contains PIN domain